MKTQNQKDEDSSEGPHHAKDVETTGEIMQRAEARKKFLRSVIKSTPAQFSLLKYGRRLSPGSHPHCIS